MTSRRDAVMSMVGVAFGGVACALAGFPKPDTYGYLTHDTCLQRGLDHRRATVYLDGVQVVPSPLTPREHVMAVDDRVGYIEIIARNANGAMYPDQNGTLARARRYGHVVVTFS